MFSFFYTKLAMRKNRSFEGKESCFLKHIPKNECYLSMVVLLSLLFISTSERGMRPFGAGAGEEVVCTSISPGVLILS